MGKVYEEVREPLPEAPPTTTQDFPSSSNKVAIVLYAENASQYIESIRVIYDDCVENDVDLFIYTDQSLQHPLDKRCVHIQFVKIGNSDNIDAFLDRAKEKFVRERGPDTSFDKKYGRIDTMKMFITLKTLRLKHYDIVAYQDIGKVASLVHLLKDPVTIKLVETFGIIQSGGAFPENYAFITHKSTLESWTYVVQGLLATFYHFPGKDTSHVATNSLPLVRQHHVYMKVSNPPKMPFGAVKQISDAVSTSNHGMLLPYQYTFVNSYDELVLAKKLSNLQCTSFSNMFVHQRQLMEDVDRICTSINVLILIVSQLERYEDKYHKYSGPFIECADDLVEEQVLGSNRESHAG